MKRFVRTLTLSSLCLLLALPLSIGGPRSLAQASDIEIGGQKPLTIRRKAVSATKPEFTSITVLPGRALLVQQITANFPGKGEIEVLASPDLAGSKKLLDQDDDQFGNQAFRLGAAFLFPYPNRVRGKLSADGKTIATEWRGKTLALPANWHGSDPGAEVNAMHGLILKRAVDSVTTRKVPGGEEIVGVIHGGDFGGHWLSKTDLTITLTLRADSVDAAVTAHNVGTETEPVAFAWHPYFNLPSGDRRQAQLHIPATDVAQVDNYDNVFPTGKINPVAGTKYDFTAPAGKPLGDIFLDDNFGGLGWKNGALTVQIVDPAAHYGVAVEGISPNVKSIQVYAPPAKNFVAVEDQTNLGDPFGKEWGSRDTGMFALEPGSSASWHVRLHVFVP